MASGCTAAHSMATPKDRHNMSSQSPDRVAVYRFEIWDHEVGDNVWGPRVATLEAIERIGGAADLASETWVNRSELDGSGYFPAKGPG
jgi:hypothetical protein